jgi:hypothetical protein
MTPIQTSAEPLTLDPATFNTMLRSTIEALPHHPHATAEARAERCDAAFFAISALRPRDPLEAMLAARIVALHYHAMYNLACCLEPNMPSDLQLRCQARGESLGRQSDKMRAEYLHNQQTNPARRPAGLPASAAVAPEPQPAPQTPHPPRARPSARRHGPSRRHSPHRAVATPCPSTMPRSSSVSPRSMPACRPPPSLSRHDVENTPCTRGHNHPPPDRIPRHAPRAGAKPRPPCVSVPCCHDWPAARR